MKAYLQPKIEFLQFDSDDICTLSNQSAGVGDTEDYFSIINLNKTQP